MAIGRGRFVLLVAAAPVAALVVLRASTASRGDAAPALAPGALPVAADQASPGADPVRSVAPDAPTDLVARAGVGSATVSFVLPRPAGAGTSYTVTATRV